MKASNRTNWIFAAGGLTAGLLVALGIWLGRIQTPGTAAVSEIDAESMARQMMLNAGNASGNDAFAVCTGPVSDGEGLFMLDFLTGQLTCAVMHPSAGGFRARATTNIVAAFPAAANKKPRYLLASGAIDMRGGGAARFAQSIIYVVDANTGAYAAYAIPWNQNAWNRGQAMVLQLQLIDRGLAREVAVTE